MRLVSLRDQVEIQVKDEGTLELAGPAFRVTLRHLSPSLYNALRFLAGGGKPEGEIVDGILAADGPPGLARWWHYLGKLSSLGAVSLTILANDEPWVTFSPTTSGFDVPAERVPPRARYVLSRFALTRRDRAKLILESPASFARVTFHGAGSPGLLQPLAEGTTAEELCRRFPGVPAETLHETLTLLESTGLARAAGADEETSPRLESWDFHDLLFHARTRMGRQTAFLGASYAMAGKMEVPGALKPPCSEDTVELVRPDPGEPSGRDSLEAVLDRRRSIRAYAEAGITLEELGGFLHRVGRVKSVARTSVQTPRGPVSMEFASRPYPSGGALYELEIYPVIHRCRGLSSGLFHYDPLHHRLERLSGRTPEVIELLRDAARSSGTDPDKLQVLLILASRFQRISWKYSSIAYATTLKNVGALYQTMYLVATEMGLAPCGIGAGNSDLFSRAAGTDYYEESSVGEFLLARPA